MASYEEGVGGALSAGEAAAILGASAGLSTATQDAITELLNSLGTSTQIDVVVTQNDLNMANVNPDATVINQTGDASANVTFAPDSAVRVMTVGGGGDSNVVFQTSEDVVVQLGGGENDSVATGDGADTITFVGGSATVNTGAGNDTVVLQGGSADNQAQANVVMGDGNGVIAVEGMTGQATIDAGDGFDLVKMIAMRAEHVFQWIAGKFTMHSDAELTMENVNVVTFDDNDDGIVDEITVLADTAGDAITAKLYQVALGREGLDGANGTNGLSGDAEVSGQLGGISYWTEVFDQGTNTGIDLQHTVYSFLNCDEFHAKYDKMTDAEYVQALFDNLGEANNTTVTTVNGMTAAELAATIGANPTGRYDVAWTVASSTEAVNILGVNGVQYVIDGFDGSDAPTA